MLGIHLQQAQTNLIQAIAFILQYKYNIEVAVAVCSSSGKKF